MDGYNPFSLNGKTILVTGASSGIGQSIAVTISRLGGDVIISGRDEVKLQKTFSMMEGFDNQILRADITNQEDVEALSISVPQLDGIVHCAGIGYRIPAKLITGIDIQKVMQANFSGAVLLQASLLMKKKINKNASIVFIASKAADYPSVGNAIYSASKGALISYARCLALELAPRGIRVNCICPDMVWTPLIMQNEVTMDQLKESEKNYLLKRFGEPEDVAYLTIYLLSDASAWMTNSCIDLTGGGRLL